MYQIRPQTYQDVQQEYLPFSLQWMGTDISNKFAVISLVGYLVQVLRKKKPNITFYQVVHELAKDELSDNYIRRLAVVCEDFAYGCKEFPTFNLQDKEIPNKIKELIHIQVPF